MSTEELRQGLLDLTGAVQDARKVKQAKVKEAQDKQSRLDLGKTVLASPEGQTLPGQLAAQGLASGQLDLEKSGSLLNQFGDPEKALMWLSSKAMSETDPVKQQGLIQAIDKSMKTYNRFQEQKAWGESYVKAAGMLQAKKEYGVLHPPRGGGGRGGGGGGANPNNENAYSASPPPADSVPMGVNYNRIAEDMDRFILKDPDLSMIKDWSKGLSQENNIDDDTYVAARGRVTKFIDDWTIKNSNLNFPGAEKYRAQVVRDTVDRFITKGPNMFRETTNEKGISYPNKWVPSVDVPKQAFLPYVTSSSVEQKSKKKTKTTWYLGKPGDKSTSSSDNIDNLLTK